MDIGTYQENKDFHSVYRVTKLVLVNELEEFC